MNSRKIEIYTDGSSRGNPGPGGYGIIMKDLDSGFVKEFSEGYRKTTNNRMELMAVVEALNKIKIKNTTITIFTDSKYVSDSVEKKWVFNWKKNNFKNKKNIDLWTRFLETHINHTINFVWIKGHNNHIQNDRCDALAVSASKKKDLLIDEYYEKNELLL